MPLDETGWTPTTGADRIAETRAVYVAAAERPVDFLPGSPEGAFTAAFGIMASRVEQDVSVVLDALSPETADGANLDRIGSFRGVPREGADSSRYIIYPTLGSGYTSATITVGTEFRDVDLQKWKAVETTADATAATPITVEAVESGPVLMADGPQTLAIVTPVTGVSGATFDATDNDEFSIGRNRESDAQYRARLREQLSLGTASSAPGLLAALLQLRWVDAASVSRVSGGIVEIFVVPSPVGSSRRTELAQTILANLALGIATQGDESEAVTVSGVTDTVYWSEGSELAITVAIVVTPSTGYTLASVSDAVASSIEGLIANLGVGDALRVLQVFRAVGGVQGVDAVTSLLLDGDDEDIVPAATEQIVLSGSVAVTETP